MSNYFAFQKDFWGNKLVPVTFDERPIPGTANARDVLAKTIRKIPEEVKGMSLEGLSQMFQDGTL